jgi:hypothetical protein
MSNSSTEHFVVPTPLQLRNLGPGCFAQVNDDNGNECVWVEIDGEKDGVLTGLVHIELDDAGSFSTRQHHQRISFTRDQVRLLGCDRFCFC